MIRTTSSLLIVAALFVSAATASASTLTFSLAHIGSADAVRVRITADPRAAIVLHYADENGDDRTIRLGTADSDGYLSSTVYSSDYAIAGGDSVYITSDTSGSLRSAARSWPVLSYGDISLLVSTLTLSPGQTAVVPVTGLGAASLFVSSNSNSAVASFSANGAQVQVVGNKAGTAKAVLCVEGSASNCDTLSVTVSAPDASQAKTFSLSAPVAAVAVGHSLDISIGGTASRLYVSSNTRPSVLQANLHSNVLTLTGIAAGYSKVEICNPSGDCAAVAVTVIAAKNTQDGFALQKNSVSVTVDDTATIAVAGEAPYTIFGSSNAKVASASVQAGAYVLVKGLVAGVRNITVCDDTNACDDLAITVSAPAAAPSPASSGSSSSGSYVFTSFLNIGSTGDEVTQLQKRLGTLGFFSASSTGYFGPLTAAAVKSFQAAHGIAAVGYVGPATRAALNAQFR